MDQGSLPVSGALSVALDEPTFPLLSTSYESQPHIPALNDFRDTESASHISPQLPTFPLPLLQDDKDFVEYTLRNPSMTIDSKMVHSYRILFVWDMVFGMCEQHRELAIRTWVQLLEGVTGDDIWLWADGDEKRMTC